jgi:hypothetical protein
MGEPTRFPRINISAIPVQGVGVVVIVAIVVFEVRVFLLAACVCGALLGLGMILARRESGISRPGGPPEQPLGVGTRYLVERQPVSPADAAKERLDAWRPERRVQPSFALR